MNHIMAPSVRTLLELLCRPRCVCLILAVVLVAALASRVALSITQFSHIDDIGVATTILQAKSHPPTVVGLLEEARAKRNEGRISPRLNLLFALERWGLLEPLYGVGTAIFPYVVVPMVWTYPPLQFVLTAALVSPGESYQAVKFWGRLPSVAFSVLSLLLLLILAPMLTRSGAGALALCMVTVAAFSGEHMTLAALMHSYAAGAVASTTLLYLAARDARSLDTSWSFVLGRSAVLIVLCYLSYQAVLLLPGYFLALAIGMLKTKPASRIPGIVLRGGIFLVIVIIAYMPAYLFRVGSIPTIHYNAGPHHEFVFAPSGGVGTILVEALRFLQKNAWITARSLVSPVSEDMFVAGVVTAVILIGLAFGLWRMIVLAIRPGSWTSAAAVGVVSAVSLGLFVGLVLAQKLAFGPTRHIFIYLPLVLAPSAYGLRLLVIWLTTRLTAWRPRVACFGASVVWTAVLATSFLAQAGTFFQERNDLFRETDLLRIARDHHVDLVIADAIQLVAMPSVAAYAPVVRIPSLGSPKAAWEGTPPTQPPRRVLIIAQTDPFETRCADIRAWLVDSFHRQSWRPCLNGLRVLYTLTVTSDVEVEFSRLTRNGTNNIYINVIELPLSSR